MLPPSLRPYYGKPLSPDPTQPPSLERPSPVHEGVWLRRALIGILALHFVPLLLSVQDYRVTADSAYHVAMGRQYGTHGTYYWDDINYQPEGRPNLYAPLVHVGIGLIGRLAGGEGDDYVLANALLGLALWLAAMGTAVFFARRLAGDRAALIAGAVLAGSAFASGSFYVNLPSAWMFVFTPWAIHFFLADRLLAASAFTSLALYSSLGGFATAPLALILAAIPTRRFRALLITGFLAALATAPYWIHVLRSLAWYTSQKGDSTWWIDPLVNLFWVVGIVAAARSRPQRTFLLAWALAPLPWFFYDTSRFIVQSSLAGSVLGAIAVTRWMDGRLERPARRWATATLVGVATLIPLGIPGLGGELTWLAKPYPRIVDWQEARVLADVIRERGLEGRLVRAYVGYMTSGLSVWADIRGVKGHWYEVRPTPDPVDTMSVTGIVYLMGVPPTDTVMTDWNARGLITVYGGSAASSLIELGSPISARAAEALVEETWARDAAWISQRCEHNSLGNWLTLFLDGEEIPRRTRIRGECRTRVARMQLALMVLLAALEVTDSEKGFELRPKSDELYWMQAVVGDPMALDYRTAAVHTRMRQDMALIAQLASAGEDIESAVAEMLDRYLGASRGKLF
ncbi:MAG: hypothetical protein BMS9Abin29_1001 [Gemmatimonadota bacterium]|nr:MAG: hypothetical protein BMS9Abin29_1001 [Gemmatimonadota bacterium]